MYKHWDEMNTSERALYLISTSADDMHSSLKNFHGSTEVLHRALRLTVRRGEKTKAKLLRSAIRRMERPFPKHEVCSHRKYLYDLQKVPGGWVFMIAFSVMTITSEVIEDKLEAMELAAQEIDLYLGPRKARKS